MYWLFSRDLPPLAARLLASVIWLRPPPGPLAGLFVDGVAVNLPCQACLSLRHQITRIAMAPTLN